MTPANAGSFVNGTWTGSVSVNAFATNVVLTADDGQGHTGTSNAFDTVLGSLHHFAWNTIASPQTVDTPFDVTVTAQDAGNNTVAFNGTAGLAAQYSLNGALVGTATSTQPPPIVPTMEPSSRTNILAVLNEGIEPRTLTMVATAPRRPCCRSLTISSYMSISADYQTVNRVSQLLQNL